jgi:hypothetical protein
VIDHTVAADVVHVLAEVVDGPVVGLGEVVERPLDQPPVLKCAVLDHDGGDALPVDREAARALQQLQDAALAGAVVLKAAELTALPLRQRQVGVVDRRWRAERRSGGRHGHEGAHHGCHAAQDACAK